MFKKKDKPIDFNDNDLASALNDPEISFLGDDVEITVIQSSINTLEEKLITVIPETCVIKGELNCTSDIHINGKINGTIRSDKLVRILKSGRVEGDIIANSIAIDGTLQGNCIGGEVSINANGVVKGQIQSDALSINRKARFHGQSLPRDENSLEANLAK